MRDALAESAAILALAVALTLILAWPLLRASDARVFGMPIVGRQHDPFTAMAGFGRPSSAVAYSQPLTDVPGAVIARVSGPVSAYNWLVLLTFPASALAAYALARQLSLSRAGSALAALLFAFSPFHLAQAAYHPHIAQTQWIPLYLLALWRCLDRGTWPACTALAGATAAVTLSNFYGGFIAAVVTPIAALAYWWTQARHVPHATRRFAMTTATLCAATAAALICCWVWVPDVLAHRASLAFPLDDVRRYSARGWSYLLPPVAHPVLGTQSLRLWHQAQTGAGLLEQQLYVGWGIAALAMVAGMRWVRGQRRGAIRIVPVLVSTGLVAFAASVAPPVWLHTLAPMFRAYARFGVIVQLMVVLLAVIGTEWLLHSGRRLLQAAAIALLALTVFDYAVRPSALSRSVWPTPAHQWVIDQPERVFALDCAGATPESESLTWLSLGRIAIVGRDDDDCAQPNLGDAAAARGYTHVIVRRHTPEGAWWHARGTPDGFRMAAWFPDADVFLVTAAVPSVHTAAMTGFWPRETGAATSWRWMGPAATWTVANTTASALMATVDVSLGAFARPRQITITLDGRSVHALVVGTSDSSYRLGPFLLAPGPHTLGFQPSIPPVAASLLTGTEDDRALSIAVGHWRWMLEDRDP